MTKENALFWLLAAAVPTLVCMASWHLAVLLNEEPGLLLDEFDGPFERSFDRSYISLASPVAWNDPD